MATVNDRELAIARIYSKAMLDLAEEQGEADNLLGELQEAVKFLGRSPEFEQFLGSPLVDDEDRSRTLERAFRGRASDLLVDSLQVVNRKGRLGLLRAIAEGYRIEHSLVRGIVEAHVRTAIPLSEALRARVRESVARYTGKQPRLIEKVDPSLIGGIVIDVEGRKIDGSVASKLRELGQALERRASEEIVRARA
ncbi:MAG TPA: ATP synthase F1 subunit delta [Thermoanaerobaculia bacterium]|nr:ATP synthase F1 subunit delta [Thermoanaerobaculia bacterium]